MNARAHLSVVADSVAPEPPYPADVLAKGWRFELDLERIRRSDTWALTPAEVRPWLLMLWAVAWEQSPCGSLPNDDALIAAHMGIPARQFSADREVLLRGWRLHADGRLYHATITERVLSMVDRRKTEAARVAAWREKRRAAAQESDVTRNQRVSTTPEPEPVPITTTQHYVLGVPADPEGSPVPTPPPDEIRREAPESVLLACPAQKLVDLYHQRLPTLPQCLVLTQARRGYLRARWREYALLHGWQSEDEGLAFFADYFAHVSKSKFLTGRARGRDDRPPFTADIEWLFRPTNFAKVVEGKYHQ